MISEMEKRIKLYGQAAQGPMARMGEPMFTRKDIESAVLAEREALAQREQHPVAWLIPGSITGDKKLAEANGDYATPLYAAPVDAKAIRAEALEEAAKWLKESGLIGSNDCAAAIRGLK